VLSVEETVRSASPTAPAAPPSPMRWVSAAATHVGRVRKVNEDALLERPQIGLWAVADGVGGASAGDRASALIAENLSTIGDASTAPAFLAAVCDRLRDTNDTLRREAAEANVTIASTVVALLFFRQHYACAWAGDSRLYRLRDGRFEQISRDHSEVQELVDRGVIDAATARHHPHANIVTRAVGATDQLEIEVVHNQLFDGDIFLLCSDGLTKTLEDDEIAQRLQQPIDQAVPALIEAALDRGAPDNVTVVAIKVQSAGGGDERE
jgi:serine/threonine protein phosphatase PrpC